MLASLGNLRKPREEECQNLLDAGEINRGGGENFYEEQSIILSA